MTRKQKKLTWISVALVVAVITVARIAQTLHSRTRPILLTGAVLREDADPRKQTPLANAKVTATDGSYAATATSDASGLFKVTVNPGLVPGRPISVRFEHEEYKPFEITEAAGGLLYLIRMEPLVRDSVTDDSHVNSPAKPLGIKNVRVRYSFKSQSTINVGSFTKQFEVVNTGNVPCKGHRPCSPDSKWKAATVTLPLDAQKGSEFRNVRVSCIAGPCPFTRLGPQDLSRPASRIQITALNWSDTVSFLVEAEVTRTMATETVLHSFPFITGQTMSFALPASAEGPSIIADLNGEEIVYPLGPSLVLSWATCTVEVAAGGNKLYRCELKPGYEFQQ